MDAHLNKKITLILTVIIIVCTVIIMLRMTNFSVGLCILSSTYVIVVLIRDYIMKLELHRMTGTLFLFFQLALAFVISIWSDGFFAQIYFLILIGEFTFHHSRNHSIIFTIMSYACSVLSLLIYRQFPPFEQISYLLPRVIIYFAVFEISILAKIVFQQQNQLARDNERLRIASIELEQNAKLQERTRISREIHDSVGHTLTSALTGLQTAAYAMGKSHYTLALEMINRTKENIHSGLDNVRSSVHLLREFPDHQFIPELKGLINETKEQTNVEIVSDIDAALPDLPPMIELTIYRALQEGITNGIRHGSSTIFQFSLTYLAGYIRFILTDNGKSPIDIIHGFGLSAMKERVEDVGGELAISSKGPASGVTLEITIPFQTNNHQTG